MKQVQLLEKVVFMPPVNELTVGSSVEENIKIAVPGEKVFLLESTRDGAALVMYNSMSKWIPSTCIETGRSR